MHQVLSEHGVHLTASWGSESLDVREESNAVIWFNCMTRVGSTVTWVCVFLSKNLWSVLNTFAHQAHQASRNKMLNDMSLLVIVYISKFWMFMLPRVSRWAGGWISTTGVGRHLRIKSTTMSKVTINQQRASIRAYLRNWIYTDKLVFPCPLLGNSRHEVSQQVIQTCPLCNSFGALA